MTYRKSLYLTTVRHVSDWFHIPQIDDMMCGKTGPEIPLDNEWVGDTRSKVQIGFQHHVWFILLFRCHITQAYIVSIFIQRTSADFISMARVLNGSGLKSRINFYSIQLLPFKCRGIHSPGLGVTKPIYYIFISNFRNHSNNLYWLDIAFIFDRCRHS